MSSSENYFLLCCSCFFCPFAFHFCLRCVSPLFTSLSFEIFFLSEYFPRYCIICAARKESDFDHSPFEIIYLEEREKALSKGRARTDPSADLSSLAPRLARFLPATVISTFCWTIPRGTSRIIIQQNIAASNARGVNVIGLHYIAASGSKKMRISLPFCTVFLPTLMEQRNNNRNSFDDYSATNVMARYFSMIAI